MTPLIKLPNSIAVSMCVGVDVTVTIVRGHQTYEEAMDRETGLYQLSH